MDLDELQKATMTEDFDKDLEDLAGELGDLDLGGEETGGEAGDLEGLDLGGEDSGDLEGLDLGGGDSGDEAAAASAGDSIELDDDLQSMLDDAGGEGAAGGDEGPDLGEMGGGEDDILGGGGGGEDDILGGGGGSAPASAPAPSRGPATAQEIMSQLAEGQTVNLEFLLDIKLHVTFEVGRSKMLISDLLTLGQGSVIELHRLVGDELDLLVNGKLIAKGEVVVVNEKFGCKITDIIPPEDRIKHMGAI